MQNQGLQVDCHPSTDCEPLPTSFRRRLGLISSTAELVLLFLFTSRRVLSGGGLKCAPPLNYNARIGLLVRDDWCDLLLELSAPHD